jgi:hypothetical protein
MLHASNARRTGGTKQEMIVSTIANAAGNIYILLQSVSSEFVFGFRHPIVSPSLQNAPQHLSRW